MGLNDIKSYMIGLVLFVVVITGGIFTMISLHSSNPALDSSRIEAFNTTFNKADNITTAVNDISSSITNAGDKPGALGWFNVLFGSAWQGLKVLFSSLGFVKGLILAVAEIFSVPPAIALLITLLPIIIIVFAIWGAIIQAQD
jgi:hypothetical protein